MDFWQETECFRARTPAVIVNLMAKPNSLLGILFDYDTKNTLHYENYLTADTQMIHFD